MCGAMGSIADIHRHRVLVATLTAKELKVRYRGSVIGFLWTFLNPLLMMLVYTLVFSVYMRAQVPRYPMFVFAGLLPWIWLSGSLSQATTAVLRDGHLLKKVNFPPVILPFVTLSATTVNFALSLPLYFVFAAAFGVRFGWPLILLPVAALLQFLVLYGLSLLLSAATVFFRDIEHLIGNLIMLLFFLTPVLYSEEMIPERYRDLAMLNPAASLIRVWRDILYGAAWPRPADLAVVLAFGALVTVAGEAIFRSLAPRFVERI